MTDFLLSRSREPNFTSLVDDHILLDEILDHFSLLSPIMEAHCPCDNLVEDFIIIMRNAPL